MKKTCAQLQKEIDDLKNKIEHYKKAIDVLQSMYTKKPHTAQDRIIFLVCRENPELLPSKEDVASPFIPEEEMKVIKDDIKYGKKIEAIKHFREATGLGLRESKEAVERMIKEIHASDSNIS